MKHAKKGVITGRMRSDGHHIQEIDKLELPACLVVTPEEAARRREWWANNPPKPMRLIQEAKRTLELPPDLISPDDLRARKQKAREAARLAKARYCDIDLERSRWDPAHNRFVDRDDPKKPAPRLQTGQMNKTTGKRVAAPRGPADDVAQRLLNYTTVDGKADRGRIEQVAKLNGVWDKKYAGLPNPGLVRMTVGNRLRGIAKKGGEVKWPKSA